ncbi:hypothetical protein [Thalassobacillus hwangdonensis]|uniref:DUF3139 domain-containing protein n=1 Tax=Thalassobacillus hwangdonensis TaxID=546108 RepID=A0ABW3L4S6_9BACI
MKKYLPRWLMLGLLIFGLLGLAVSGTLFQEGNPIPLLKAITKLELSDEGYEKFATTEDTYRYIAKNSGEDRYDVVKTFMAERGWEYEEQMGAGLIFSNGEEGTVVETKLYSRIYYLWDVQRESLDE